LQGIAPALRDKLVVVDTPNGYHVYYRAPVIEGNQKLALDKEGKVRIETRGEGGYVLCPCDNLKDDDGAPRYKFLRGAYATIPGITENERETLLSYARFQTEYFPVASTFADAGDKHDNASGREDPTLPGQDYCTRTSWPQVLEPLGWVLVRERADRVTEWRRPGKDDGVSATTGINGSDLFYLFSSSVPGLVPNRGYSKFSVYTFLTQAGDFEKAAATLRVQGFGSRVGELEPPGTGDKSDPTQAKKESQIGVLIKIASTIPIRVTTDNEPYADLDQGTYPVGSDAFLSALDHAYGQQRSGARAGETTLSDAVAKISRDSKLYIKERCPAFIRNGYDGQNIYVDLGQDVPRCVKITAEDPWTIIEKPPIIFKRTGGGSQRPLPHPTIGGSVDALRQFINVADDNQWVLLVAWLLNTFNPFGTYPILLIQGGEGSAKSTAASILRRIIDPAVPELLMYPKSPETIITDAYHNFLLTYDNLSGISNETSDTLCVVSSGAGFAARTLYTNLGRTAFEFKRPVVLNGIDNIARRNDFASRSLLLYFEKVKQRYTLEKVEAGVRAIVPGILGQLYSAVGRALREYQTTSIAGHEHRLSDFVRWSLAGLPALGITADQFGSAMGANENAVGQSVIENDIVAQYIEIFMSQRKEPYAGPAAQLFELLEGITPMAIKRSNGWPTSPVSLGLRLMRAAGVLATHGIKVEKEHKRTGTFYKVEKI
jgi:hypothetical protein